MKLPFSLISARCFSFSARETPSKVCWPMSNWRSSWRVDGLDLKVDLGGCEGTDRLLRDAMANDIEEAVALECGADSIDELVALGIIQGQVNGEDVGLYAR